MTVNLGGRLVGDGQPCYIVAEIGINHNGSIETAKQLIDVAIAAGCDAVKFQKRDLYAVYSKEELERPRESPFGTTNLDLKRGLEFGWLQYVEIDAYCRGRVQWFASSWDQSSITFMEQFNPPCHKIASACLTDHELLRVFRASGRPLILSTGMSTMFQVQKAAAVLDGAPLILLHACSAYPASYDDLNLLAIRSLKWIFEKIPVGYSGHETGIASSVAAVALGACVIERHITLDRAMWGSDQSASLEPTGLTKLVRDIRLVERSLGDGVKRICESEIPAMKKLRRYGDAGGSSVS